MSTLTTSLTSHCSRCGHYGHEPKEGSCPASECSNCRVATPCDCGSALNHPTPCEADYQKARELEVRLGLRETADLGRKS